jgi:hypothetical protein
MAITVKLGVLKNGLAGVTIFTVQVAVLKSFVISIVIIQFPITTIADGCKRCLALTIISISFLPFEIMRSIYLLIICFLLPCFITYGDTQASLLASAFFNGDRQVSGKAHQHHQQPWSSSQTDDTATDNSTRSAAELSSEQQYQGVPFLVQMLGKRFYAAMNRPKYKFYIFMTFGTKLPNEQDSIIMLNMLCNILYSLSILLGFVFLPRGIMLLLTLVTLLIGPALVLFLLGCLAMIVVAFSLFPMRSVMCLWLYFFLTSKVAQILGRRLGLDHDGDGDVDLLDILHYASTTRWGKTFGILPKLHDLLNRSAMDPFQAIHRRLDQIQQLQKSDSQRLLVVNENSTSIGHATTTTPPTTPRLKKEIDKQKYL